MSRGNSLTPDTGDATQLSSPSSLRMNLHVGVLHYDPSFEPFPLLTDPVNYEPNTVDISGDKHMLDYWLTVLSDSIPTIMAKAVASEGGKPGTTPPPPPPPPRFRPAACPQSPHSSCWQRLSPVMGASQVLLPPLPPLPPSPPFSPTPAICLQSPYVPLRLLLVEGSKPHTLYPGNPGREGGEGRGGFSEEDPRGSCERSVGRGTEKVWGNGILNRSLGSCVICQGHSCAYLQVGCPLNFSAMCFGAEGLSLHSTPLPWAALRSHSAPSCADAMWRALASRSSLIMSSNTSPPHPPPSPASKLKVHTLCRCKAARIGVWAGASGPHQQAESRAQRVWRHWAG